MWQKALWASLQSVGTVALIACIGLLLARMGYLEKPARKSLAKVVMQVGVPTLLFTRLLDCPQCRRGDPHNKDCPPCTDPLEYVREAWFVLLIPFILTGLGLPLGRLVADLTGCPESFRSTCMVAVAIPNYLGIPIVVLDNLGAKLQELGVVSGDPVPYHATMNLTAEAVLFTVGSYMLEARDSHSPETVPEEPKARERLFSDASVATDPESGTAQDVPLLPKLLIVAQECWRFCEGIVKIVIGLPPVWGLAAAVAVAVVSPTVPLLSLLVDQAQTGSAPLTFAFSALTMLGRLVVPMNLMVLGANLSKGYDSSMAPVRTTLGIAFAKLIVTPAMMVVFVFVAARVLPPQRSEIWFIFLLEGCPPTGNMVSTLVELCGAGSEALSAAMMVQYYFAPFTITVWLTVFSALLQSDWYILEFAS